MSQLPSKLVEGLQLLPPDLPIHLLTRHSIRELATDGFANYRLPLTEEGLRLARDWGRRLSLPLAACYSSPVQRCVDTAAAMLEGAGEGQTIRQTRVLVEPGCYVTDLRRAGRRFLQLGALGFINQQLVAAHEGVLTQAEGRDKLLGHLAAHQPPAGELAIHVTHDTILAAFLAGLRGCRRVAPVDWPEMMEGVWLWFAHGRVHWVWRGQPGSRPFRSPYLV